MRRRVVVPSRWFVSAVWIASMPALVLAGPPRAVAPRPAPRVITVDRVQRIEVTLFGRGSPGGGYRGCSGVSTHTDADFTGGTFTLQAGMAESEILAATYVLPASTFPIRLDLAEVIFATQNAVVETTTQWSMLVWQGDPRSGTLIFEISSDGTTIPHVVLPPGTNAVDLAVGVDPGDPQQIIIDDDGSHSFSVGFRIDQHNNQTQNPCISPPPTSSNAFPVTDASGLAAPADNWLFALDCGPLGCPSGWRRFSELGLCRPSGDWVVRASWTSLPCEPVGACCMPDGSCQLVTASECANLGGSYQGDNTDCATANCAPATEACCFPSTGGCLDLTPTDCTAAGGVPGGPGTTCSTFVCFPQGACCLPDGSCADGMSPEDCDVAGGVFQGDGTTCADVNCPAPVGACCFDTGFCLELTEHDCALAGGSWGGAGTDCADNDGNGMPDACEGCIGDLDNNGQVDLSDLATLLAFFGTTSGATPAMGDLDNDADVDLNDLATMLAFFGQSCP